MAFPPGVVIGLLLVLALSQLFYAFWPYARRSYLPALLLTAVRVGQANLLPAALFAVALQPLADRLPSPRRA
jgi:hypothetical protein